MKLFVFDIDSTLVSHSNRGSYIPDSAKKAIEMIQNAGHCAIIATGRCYNVTQHIMEEVNINSAVLCNGSTIVEDFEVVYNKPMHSNANKKFLEDIKKSSLPAIAFDSHNIYIYDEIENKEKFVNAISTFVNPMFEGTSYSLQKLSFDKEYNSISIFSKTNVNIFEDISETWYDDHGYELMEKTSTKATGILKYINDKSILKEDVYVFGDNYNDISMFEEFYENSYVLGNANNDVKDFAKNICDHIDNDGVYKAVVSILK